MTTHRLNSVWIAALAALALTACAQDTGEGDGQVQLEGEDVRVEADAGGRADVGEPEPTPDASSAPDVAAPEDVGEPEPDVRPPEGRTLMGGITISEVEAYQTVRVPVMEEGEASIPEIPLVANRETLLRAFVEVGPGWTPREVLAEFVLVDGAGGEEVFAQTRQISGSSDVLSRVTIFETRVPPERITTGTRVQVRLIGEGPVEVASDAPSGARWPTDGAPASLGATDETGTLELVLVPIRWDRDGSGRMPDLSMEQLGRLEGAVRALYPMANLDLSIREEISWTGSVDWGDFNTELRRLKTMDGADEAYYYGLVAPDVDFNAYCNGRCTTGQSFTVSSASSSSYRVGTGLGFGGDRWTWTLVHELGHMHGRGHAPCDVSFFSRDRNYPYSGGDVGVWGWDSRSGTIYGPEGAADYMGYCDEQWSSDYTYGGIYDRMSAVWARSGAGAVQGPERAWRWLMWSDDEPARWGARSVERDPSTGEVCEVLDAQGASLGFAPLARMSHGGAAGALVLESTLGAHGELTLACPDGVIEAPAHR